MKLQFRCIFTCLHAPDANIGTGKLAPCTRTKPWKQAMQHQINLLTAENSGTKWIVTWTGFQQAVHSHCNDWYTACTSGAWKWTSYLGAAMTATWFPWLAEKLNIHENISLRLSLQCFTARPLFFKLKCILNREHGISWVVMELYHLWKERHVSACLVVATKV